MAGPDLPPQDDGRKHETGEGQEVEAHGAQRPQSGAGARLREDLISFRRHGSQRSNAALFRIGRNDVVRRVSRHVHPTGPRRRAYCRGPRGTRPGMAVRMIEVVPDDRRCVVVGAGLFGLFGGLGPDRAGLERSSPGDGRGARSRALGSKGDARIFRLGYPGAALRRDGHAGPATLARPRGRHGSPAPPRPGQVTLGDEATLRAIAGALEAAGAPVEQVAAGEAARRYPGIAAAGMVLVEPGSGHARSRRMPARAAAGRRIRGRHRPARDLAPPIVGRRHRGDRRRSRPPCRRRCQLRRAGRTGTP